MDVVPSHLRTTLYQHIPIKSQWLRRSTSAVQRDSYTAAHLDAVALIVAPKQKMQSDNVQSQVSLVRDGFQGHIEGQLSDAEQSERRESE
jgi:hypothetical protein